MTTRKHQMAKKKTAHAMHRVGRRGTAQKKDIQVLLKATSDYENLDLLTESLKWQIIIHNRDLKKVRTFKYSTERDSFLQHLLIDRIKEGIDAEAFEKVTDAYDIPMTVGYRVMGIPQSTYRRRLEKGKLLPGESDRVYRYAELMTMATEMMQQDSDRAAAWFKTEMDIFGGETPLQHAMTEVGAREVEDLIGRIRYGVFS
jgi:putative toxin-antitoxin system antitoxin component (TIGR02293 family)